MRHNPAGRGRAVSSESFHRRRRSKLLRISEPMTISIENALALVVDTPVGNRSVSGPGRSVSCWVWSRADVAATPIRRRSTSR